MTRMYVAACYSTEGFQHLLYTLEGVYTSEDACKTDCKSLNEKKSAHQRCSFQPLCVGNFA